MSAIGGMLGLQGGAGGSGFAAPTAATINNGTTADQLSQSYQGNQNSLQSQQALLSAIQGQNGLGNQSQVYNQLQGVANGTGPNPAQAQLAQSTGANVANQAAMMAGQRGAGANVGLMARQAAQQGANTQQQAAGQAATLQAQQSLNAINSAGNIANTQAANQIGATNANTQAQQSEQGILQGANTAANNANVSMQSNINSGNAGLANTQMQGGQAMIGGVMNGAGAALGLAKGGTVQKMAEGGSAGGPQSSFGQFLAGSQQMQNQSGSGIQGGGAPEMSQPGSGSQALQQGASSLGKGAGKAIKGSGSTPMTDAGYQMPQMGPQFDQAPAPTLGADIGAAPAASSGDPSLGNFKFKSGGSVGDKLKGGGHVPGKAKVAGNSYANDNVKALLSPGEGVIDRETMADKGPAGQMARTLMAIVNAKKKSGK